MTSKSEQTRMNRMFECIKKAGTEGINKFDLQDLLGISVDTYNQISAKFLHRYQDQLHQIEYSRKSKRYRLIEITHVDPSNQELLTEQ